MGTRAYLITKEEGKDAFSITHMPQELYDYLYENNYLYQNKNGNAGYISITDDGLEDLQKKFKNNDNEAIAEIIFRLFEDQTTGEGVSYTCY